MEFYDKDNQKWCSTHRVAYLEVTGCPGCLEGEARAQRQEDRLPNALDVLKDLTKPGEPTEISQTAKGTKSSPVPPLSWLPFDIWEGLARIFFEGRKYGENNWRRGREDPEWRRERGDHALLHLKKWIDGDRSEAHIFKVLWYCCVESQFENAWPTSAELKATISEERKGGNA